MRKIAVFILSLLIVSSCIINVHAKSISTGWEWNTIEDYEAYLAENRKGNWFITGDELAFMGTFFSFRAHYNNSQEYQYVLTDSNRNVFTVHIAHTDIRTDPSIQIPMQSGMENMLCLSEGTSGTIVRNNIHYNYEEVDGVGKLKEIIWQGHGACFQLKMPTGTYFFGENETFLNLLLSASDADLEKAMDMFEAGITVSNDRFIVLKVIAVIVGGIAIIAGIVVLVIVMRKRYLRRKYAAFDIEI